MIHNERKNKNLWIAGVSHSTSPTDPTPEVPCELGVPAVRARAPPPLSASLSPQPSGPAELIESERPSSKAVHSGPGRTAVGRTSANRSGKMLHRARSQGIHCTTIGGRGRQECQPTASPLLHLRLLHLLLHLLLLGVAAPFDRQDARESAQLHKGKDIIRKLGQGEPRSVRVE